MMQLPSIPFPPQEPAQHEVEVVVSTRVTRITAANPSPFTFHGTNTYLIRSEKNIVVVDPGPAAEDAPLHLTAICNAISNSGRMLSHILITHTHSDHSTLAADLLHQYPEALTVGYGQHPVLTEDILGDLPSVSMDDHGDMKFAPDIAVSDGQVLKVDDTMSFSCIYTPGHISNHMCYAFIEEDALFAGDHVMSFSTTIVNPPPFGDMVQYMQSLQKLIEHDPPFASLYPAHGCPIVGVADVLAVLEALLAHRCARETQVLECVNVLGLQSLDDMVPILYADKPPSIWSYAKRSLFSHLVKLVQDGKLDAVFLDVNKGRV
eukprot:ANDGO_05026.mRNA.1 Beta-lactamase-like protein 2 homolog